MAEARRALQGANALLGFRFSLDRGAHARGRLEPWVASSGRRAVYVRLCRCQDDELCTCSCAMTEESCRTVESRPTSPGGGMTSSVTQREPSLLLICGSLHCNLRQGLGSSP